MTEAKKRKNTSNKIGSTFESKLIKVFEKYRNTKIILNQSLLSNHDVLDFEYETNTKTFYNLPPLNDQENDNPALDNLLVKLGFLKQETGEQAKKKGLFDLFK